MTVTALPQPHPLGLAVELRQLETELNVFFLERRDPIRTTLTCMLAAANGFILGPPGTGKSLMLETICRAIVGAKYWRILLDRQMGKEDSFGAHDIPKYLSGGGWSRDITDTFADAHLALLDECGNVGPAVMNAYLTIMNERQYKPNNSWIDVPLISAFGASNFWLEDMPAMWDRFPVRFTVDNMQDEGNFMLLMERASGNQPGPQITTTIDLADLQQAIKVDVPNVVIPPALIEAFREIRADLSREGIVLSNRRWVTMWPLVKGAAFMEGRTVAQDDDLAIMQHMAWELPEHAELVRPLILGRTNPLVKVAMEWIKQIDSISTEVNARKGKAVTERADYAGTANFELDQIEVKLAKAITDATDLGRNTIALDEVRDSLQACRIKVYVDAMGTPPERAANMFARR